MDGDRLQCGPRGPQRRPSPRSPGAAEPQQRHLPERAGKEAHHEQHGSRADSLRSQNLGRPLRVPANLSRPPSTETQTRPPASCPMALGDTGGCAGQGLLLGLQGHCALPPPTTGLGRRGPHPDSVPRPSSGGGSGRASFTAHSLGIVPRAPPPPHGAPGLVQSNVSPLVCPSRAGVGWPEPRRSDGLPYSQEGSQLLMTRGLVGRTASCVSSALITPHSSRQIHNTTPSGKVACIPWQRFAKKTMDLFFKK